MERLQDSWCFQEQAIGTGEARQKYQEAIMEIPKSKVPVQMWTSDEASTVRMDPERADTYETAVVDIIEARLE